MLFNSIKVSQNGKSAVKFPNASQKNHPYILKDKNVDTTQPTFNIEIEFMGHYNEPNLSFDIEMLDLIENGKVEYEMVFGAADTGKWEIIVKKGKDRDVIGVVGDFKQTANT